MKPARLLVVTIVALFAVVGTALAANRNYAVHLSKDGSALEYKLITANIDNVFMAHISVKK